MASAERVKRLPGVVLRNDLTLDGRIDNKDVGTYKIFRGDSL